MMLKDEAEAANSREKLSELEDRCEALRRGAEPDARLRDLSMQSLKRLINQLKEEIARYDARHAGKVGRPDRSLDQGAAV